MRLCALPYVCIRGQSSVYDVMESSLIVGVCAILIVILPCVAVVIIESSVLTSSSSSVHVLDTVVSFLPSLVLSSNVL